MSASALSPQDSKAPTALGIPPSQDHDPPENAHMALKPIRGLMEPWTKMFSLFSVMHQFVTVSPAAQGPSTRLCKLQTKSHSKVVEPSYLQDKIMPKANEGCGSGWGRLSCHIVSSSLTCLRRGKHPSPRASLTCPHSPHSFPVTSPGLGRWQPKALVAGGQRAGIRPE